MRHPRLLVLLAGWLGMLSASAARAAEHPPFPALALVLSDDVRIRTSPGLKGRYAGVLYRNMTVTALEESRTSETIGEITAPWYKVRSDDVNGWVFGGFLQFNVTGPTDTWESDGSMDWFYERFGQASYGRHPGMPAGSSLSTEECRNLLAAAAGGDAIAAQAIQGAIYDRIKRTPADPGLAHLKRRAYAPAYVISLLRQEHFWLFDALPGTWWTRDRALEALTTCLGTPGLATKLCERGVLKAGDLTPSICAHLLSLALAQGGASMEATRCAVWPAVIAHRSDPAWREAVALAESQQLVYAFLGAGHPWVAPLMPRGWWTPERLLGIAREPGLPQGIPTLALTTGLVPATAFSPTQLRELLEILRTRPGPAALELLRLALYAPLHRGGAPSSVLAFQDELRSDAFVTWLIREKQFWIVDVLDTSWWTGDRVRTLMLDPATPTELAGKLVGPGRVDMFRLSASAYLDLIAAVETSTTSRAALTYLGQTAYPYFAVPRASPRYAAVRKRLHAKALTDQLVQAGERWILPHLPPSALGRADVLPWLTGSDQYHGMTIYEALPDRLKDDPQIALAVLELPGETDGNSPLCGMSDAVRSNRAVALAAVRRHGYALRCVDSALQDDRGLVLVAVKGSRCAIQYASPRLQQDAAVRAAAGIPPDQEDFGCDEY